MSEEQVMDAAVSAALAGDPPIVGGESGDEGIWQSERGVRETVSRLAAASPHLKPSPDLRARILQVSAPRTFKLEDYRKVGKEDFRWYKWGFYAAAAFLILGAMYNLNVNNNLQRTRTALNDVVSQANARLDALNKGQQQRDAAIAALVTPGMQITWNDPKTNKPFGRGVVDSSGHAVLIFPKELVPAGFEPRLALKADDGRVVTFPTTLVVAPAKEIHLDVPANADQITAALAKSFSSPQQLTPGEQPGAPRAASIFTVP